jgi:hypothetical protein
MGVDAIYTPGGYLEIYLNLFLIPNKCIVSLNIHTASNKLCVVLRKVLGAFLRHWPIRSAVSEPWPDIPSIFRAAEDYMRIFHCSCTAVHKISPIHASKWAKPSISHDYEVIRL